MRNQLFSDFNPAELGPHLELSQANRNVTTDADGLDKDRVARALFGKVGISSPQTWFAELLIYSKAETPPSGHLIVLGVATSDVDLSAALGSDVNGWGYATESGDIYNDGGVILSTGVLAGYGDIIGLLLVTSSTLATLSFIKNGTLFASIELDSSLAVAPAVSLGSVVAGDIQLFLNAGQWAFTYPPQNARGWWEPRVDVAELFMASEDYTSLPTDTNPNVQYPGVVNVEAPTLRTSSSLSFWPMRGSAASVSSGSVQGSVQLVDPDNQYGYLIGSSTRNLPFRVYQTTRNESRADAPCVASLLIDRVTGDDDYRKTIRLRTVLSALDQMLQRRYYLPNVDDSAAGTPCPIVIGPAHTFVPTLINAVDNVYDAGDTPIGQMGSVRIAGKLQTAGVDYFLSDNQRGIRLTDPPAGKLTMDTSSFGGSTVDLVDIFAGAGHFEDYADASYLADNWTIVNRSAGPDPAFDPYWEPSDKHVYFPTWGTQTGQDVVAALVWPTPDVIQTGRSYTVKINIAFIPGYSPTAGYVVGRFFVALIQYFYENGFAVWSNPNSAASGVQASQGELSVTFTNLTGANQDFRLAFTGSLDPAAGQVVWVELYELPDATSVDVLTPLTLAQYMQEVLETRAGFPSTFWNIADANAIDVATGYAGVGNRITEQTSVRQSLQAVLDSYTADVYTDNAGVVRVGRLVAPEDVTPLGEITPLIIAGPVSTSASVEDGAEFSAPVGMIAVCPCVAPGLTTTAAVRQNYDAYTAGDFGDTSLSDCSNNLRVLLRKLFQQKVASGEQVAPEYFAQTLAESFKSKLDSPADALAEASRVARFFSVPRTFYAIPIVSEAAAQFDLDQVWTLVYPIYDGLASGKPVYVLAKDYDVIPQQLTLITIG